MRLLITPPNSAPIDATDKPVSVFLKESGIPKEIRIVSRANGEVLATPKGMWINGVQMFFCDDCLPLWYRGMAAPIGGEKRLNSYNLLWHDRATLEPMRCYCIYRDSFTQTPVPEFVMDTLREVLKGE